jgi:(p)ppGpp synthase/HD superfamily hydrolase
MNILTPAQVLAYAIAFAAERHSRQTDKAGVPYILHTLKVMHYLRSDDYELMAIAVLHDVIEDTSATYEDLQNIGMTDRVIRGVASMTKLPGQTANGYLAQVMLNPDAVLVKMADLRHNSDIRRLKGVTEKDIRRVEKYNRMYEELKQVASTFGKTMP